MNINMKNIIIVFIITLLLYIINLIMYLIKIEQLKKVLAKIRKIVNGGKITFDPSFREEIYSIAEEIYSIAPEINELSGPYNHISRNTANLPEELLCSIDSLKDKLDYAKYNFKRNKNPFYFLKNLILYILNIPSSFVKLFGFKINPKTSKIINILIWIILVILDTFISHYVENFINNFIVPFTHLTNTK